MLFWRPLAFAATILVLVISTSDAQDRRRGPRINRYDLLSAKLYLMKMPDVQTELKIEVTSLGRIEEILKSTQKKTREAYMNAAKEAVEARKAGVRSRQFTAKAIETRNVAYQKANKEITQLLTPEQYDRLNELVTQRLGWEAVFYEEYQKLLEITDKQLQKFEEKNEKLKDIRRESYAELRMKGVKPRELLKKLSEQYASALGKFAKETLTEKQIKALEKMKGKPFKFSK